MPAPASKAQEELLKHASFEPVFDDTGRIVDLRELRVSTDRRRGCRAMRELLETHEPGDDLVHADGFTGRQKRILRSAAPDSAHYLKASQKWDAREGVMRDTIIILLPFEVVWTLFEGLFEAQYSIETHSIVEESEEISPVGTDHRGEPANDRPGRLFHARATVKITLHLAGGQTRVFEGVGVSYSDISVGETGNVQMINWARRVAEKGAVSDAKREALSHMGPVFRRAYEDGDEMIDHIEDLLLQEIQRRNKPAIHRGHTPKTVPVPQRPAGDGATIHALPGTVSPAAEPESAAPSEPAPQDSEADTGQTATAPDTRVVITVPGGPDRHVNTHDLDTALVDTLFETCATLSEAESFMAANDNLIAAHVSDRGEIESAVASFCEDPALLEGAPRADGDGIPAFDVPDAQGSDPAAPAAEEDPAGTAADTSEAASAEVTPDDAPTGADDAESQEDVSAAVDESASAAPAPDTAGEGVPTWDAPVIDPQGKSGKAILDALVKEMENLHGRPEHIEKLEEANGAAMRKLTPKQMQTFLTARNKHAKG